MLSIPVEKYVLFLCSRHDVSFYLTFWLGNFCVDLLCTFCLFSYVCSSDKRRRGMVWRLLSKMSKISLCDHMPRLFVQYLAISSRENLPNTFLSLSRFNIWPITTKIIGPKHLNASVGSKFCQLCQILWIICPIVKCRQIWSHWTCVRRQRVTFNGPFPAVFPFFIVFSIQCSLRLINVLFTVVWIRTVHIWC